MSRPQNDGRYGQEQTRRLLQRLLEKTEEAGILEQVTAALGRGRRFLSGRLHDRSIRLGLFLEALKAADLDAPRFLRAVLGEERDKPRGERPSIIAKARQQMVIAEAGDPGSVTAADLERLARMCREAPYRVPGLAEEAIRRAGRAAVPSLLAAAGSAWRALGRPDPAHHAIEEGLAIAHKLSHWRAAGDLFLQLAYLYGDRGESCEGLSFAKESLVAHTYAGHDPGIGQALMAQGIFLYHLGRPTDAIQAFRAAVARLPRADKRRRFSIFHHLAVIHRDLGDPEAAMQHVRRARAESDDVEAELLGRLVSLEAALARDMRCYRESEISFREVVEIYRPVSAIDAAVGAVELVQTQILRGTRRAARETLERMIALIEPLREHEAVSAALMELIRCRADGVKMAVVKKVKATIKKERERLAKTPPIDETTVLRAAPPPPPGLR